MNEKKNRKRFHLEHWQKVAIYLGVFDAIAVNAAYFLALWIRFDCQYAAIPREFLNVYLYFIPIYSVFCILVFWCLRLYQSIWRFASFSELNRVILATILTSVFHIAGTSIICVVMKDNASLRMPISYYIFGTAIQFVLVLMVRFSYRYILLQRGYRDKKVSHQEPERVLLIGAGSAGQMILRDVQRAKETQAKVYGIIDDNPNKWNRYIDGIPILGGRDKIASSVQKYQIDKILIAMPGASAKNRKEIIDICKDTGCEVKNLPGMYQFFNGDITVSAMKDVAVEDLLGRDPITVDMNEIFDYLQDKTILVTGGGGSIGSELCRQIASHNPKQLIIFDIYENNAYAIQQELQRAYPDLNLTVLIGSVRDSRRINNVFATYKPDVVYHAAAHKHVPLMEDSPKESIKNNVIGTYKTAYAAMLYGCKRFVLISTDKAVNPTNIMGASKRLCEMVVQTFDRLIKEGREDMLPLLYAHACDEVGDMEHIKNMETRPTTEYVAVRFGNVLGSNGSVIPLFKEQIEAGGPVTVTHPDIIRYFMTIPEAVSLVLQAGVYAQGGEIFVLDMGSPMKIDTLARNLIQLSGHKPDEDIQIVYTGLRPGEKLYEEKLMAEEGLQTTKNQLIHICQPISFDEKGFLVQMQKLMVVSYDQQSDVRQLVADMVGTYTYTPNENKNNDEV